MYAEQMCVVRFYNWVKLKKIWFDKKQQHWLLSKQYADAKFIRLCNWIRFGLAVFSVIELHALALINWQMTKTNLNAG